MYFLQVFVCEKYFLCYENNFLEFLDKKIDKSWKIAAKMLEKYLEV